MGKFHNILYIALRTCWDWGVRDSAVVVVLLGKLLKKLQKKGLDKVNIKKFPNEVLFSY